MLLLTISRHTSHWAVPKELKQLQLKTIETYLSDDSRKRSGKLRTAYEIAKDPSEWEESLKNSYMEVDEEEEEEEADEEEDMLAEEGDRPVASSAASKKRKRAANEASSADAKKGAAGKKAPASRGKKESAAKKRKVSWGEARLAGRLSRFLFPRPARRFWRVHRSSLTLGSCYLPFTTIPPWLYSLVAPLPRRNVLYDGVVRPWDRPTISQTRRRGAQLQSQAARRPPPEPLLPMARKRRRRAPRAQR